jgi:hypothetical protein
VNKDQFYYLIKNYTSLNKEETQELVSLQNDYPYSQVVHSVVARASQENDFPGKDNFLHLSAIYCTDRGVLKSLMTAPVKKREAKTVMFIPPVEKPAVVETAVSITHTEIPSGDALYEEVKHDLERLNELRHKFEETVEEIERTSSKPEEIKQIAQEEIANEGIIEQIKTTKQQIVPEGSKQIEQIQIIDKFIKTQPTISRNKAVVANVPDPSSDLAEDSVLFGENIVSETLVEILLKQGKKDKAIEVLKKLIWKFPQKKAYFAAQIEELKK